MEPLHKLLCSRFTISVPDFDTFLWRLPSGREGRYIIGRREKWPEKVGRRETAGRKCREEGENEMLGVGRLQ